MRMSWRKAMNGRIMPTIPEVLHESAEGPMVSTIITGKKDKAIILHSFLDFHLQPATKSFFVSKSDGKEKQMYQREFEVYERCVDRNLKKMGIKVPQLTMEYYPVMWHEGCMSHVEEPTIAPSVSPSPSSSSSTSSSTTLIAAEDYYTGKLSINTTSKSVSKYINDNEKQQHPNNFSQQQYVASLTRQFYHDLPYFRTIIASFWGANAISVSALTLESRPFLQIAFGAA